MTGARPAGVTRLALSGAALLALFAVLFTAGSALGAWPSTPVGAFLGWDLRVGLGVGAAWLIALLMRRGRGMSSQAPC